MSTGIAGLSIEDSTADKSDPLFDFQLSVERIMAARAAIDRTLPGFSDIQRVPPGDAITNNKQRPFVWAEEHYR